MESDAKILCILYVRVTTIRSHHGMLKTGMIFPITPLTCIIILTRIQIIIILMIIVSVY